MEQVETVKTDWITRIARCCGAWLVVQTLLFGLIMWVGAFQVLVRGASFKYEPPDSQEPVELAYYEPEGKKK